MTRLIAISLSILSHPRDLEQPAAGHENVTKSVAQKPLHGFNPDFGIEGIEDDA